MAEGMNNTPDPKSMQVTPETIVNKAFAHAGLGKEPTSEQIATLTNAFTGQKRTQLAL